MGTKYSPEEWQLNKQLCKAAGLGQEKEMRRLVRAGADPSYQVTRVRAKKELRAVHFGRSTCHLTS